MTTADCNHIFDRFNTAGILMCRFCSTFFRHEHVWVREGVSSGTVINDVPWSDYERCFCGANKDLDGGVWEVC